MSRWKKPGDLGGEEGVGPLIVETVRGLDRAGEVGEGSSGSIEARSGAPAGAVLAVPRSLRSEMLQRLEAMK